MKIALCGNPNVGKTTLFNRITRADEPVGNWHGVTVDVKSKSAGGVTFDDLPGTYSLTARTAEERITRDRVLHGGYDVVLCVAEVNNLRRNLYIFMQLVEAELPVVLVVNMMDEARGKVDLPLLSKRLGVPVVGTSSKYKNPKNDIIDAAKSAVKTKAVPPDYFRDARIGALSRSISDKARAAGFEPAYAAMKLCERDGDVMSAVSGYGKVGCGGCAECKACDIDYPAVLRYKYIDKVLAGAVERPPEDKRTLKIDKVVLGKLALPIFLLVMTVVFVITFEAGKPLSDLLVSLISRIGRPVHNSGLPEWAELLLVDGVINGIGSVVAFLPQVTLLFVLTAVLQDSGYMSRVAFVTDDFFKKFGLSGRAAFSAVLGLGCSATAVLSSRGISGDGARRRTAFATPFFPCSARLAVFTAITSYFGMSGIAVAAMYVLGFLCALAVLKIMQAVRPDKSTGGELIMEMPPYRVPGLKRVATVAAHNVWSFVSRVGSVVLAMSVIMWALCNFSVADGFIPGGGEKSIMGMISAFVAPIFAPLGFGSWQAVTALVSGVAAKEAVVSVISALGGMDVVFANRTAALSFMIFTCLYVPCVATVSALAKETGVKTAALSVATHTLVAYTASTVFYQSATLLQVDPKLFVTVAAVVVIVIATIFIFMQRLFIRPKIVAN